MLPIAVLVSLGWEGLMNQTHQANGQSSASVGPSVSICWVESVADVVSERDHSDRLFVLANHEKRNAVYACDMFNLLDIFAIRSN